jgi:hypothetical protein
LEAALRYSAIGWAVIPLYGSDGSGRCTCPKERECGAPAKHPATRHGLKDASTDPVQIEAWFRERPGANLGILTGAESGLVVLDVDPRHGGNESLAQLEREHGPLPETVEALTGGGGRHILFRHPGGKIPSTAGFLPGLDIRADGGYFVAPPSVHASGRRYEWELSSEPGTVPLAPMPAWLLDLVTKRIGRASAEPTAGGVIPRGRRHVALIELSRKYARLGLKQDEIAALVKHARDTHCEDPSTADTDEEIEKTAGADVERFGPRASEEERSSPERFRIVESLGAYLALPVKARRAFVPGVMFEQDFVLLAGMPYSGKSLLLIDLALALASGRQWIGFETEQARVGAFFREIPQDSLLVRIAQLMAEEDLSGSPRETVLARLPELAAAAGLSDLPLFLAQPPWVTGRVSIENDLEALKDFCTSKKLDVLILDPLSRLHFHDEDKSSEMAPVLSCIDELREQLGLAVVLAHHTPKAGTTPRGTGRFLSDPTSNWFLSEISEGKRRLQIEGNDTGKLPPIDYFLENGKLSRLEYSSEADRKEALRGSIVRAVADRFTTGKRIAEHLRENPRSVQRQVRALVDEGRLKRIKRTLSVVPRDPECEEVPF